MTTMPAQQQPRLLVGALDIGAFLGISERQIMHLVRTGRLPVIRLGRRIAARPATLERWLDERERADAEESADAA